MHIAFISMRYPRKESEYLRIFERKLVNYLKNVTDVSVLSWALSCDEKAYDLDGVRVDIIPCLDYTRIQRLYDKNAGFGAAVLDLVNDLFKIMNTVSRVHRLHKRKKIDVIISASFSMSAFYAILAAKLKRIPLVTQSFGYDVSVVPSIDYGARLKFNKEKLTSDLALKYSDLILPNSRGLAEDTVLKNYRKKVSVVYHGVDPDDYDRRTIGSRLKKQDRSKKRFMVLHVGGLQKVKGWSYIVDTADRLKEHDIEFILVGGRDDELGHYNKKVKKLGLKNIKYLGAVSHEDMMKYYYQADVFFLPSLSEGLPNSMLEAAAMELALIGSGEGGTRDIIDEGKNGYYIRDPDAGYFSEKILYLYNNPEILKKMKAYSRKVALKRFNWDDIVKNLVKVLKGLTNNPPEHERS